MEAVINGCRALRLLGRSDLLLMMVLPHCNRRRPLWDLISKNFKRETSNIFLFAQTCYKMLIVRREKANKLAFSSLSSPWGADDEGCDEGEDVWFIFVSFGNKRQIDCRLRFFCFFLCSCERPAATVRLCGRVKRTSVSVEESWGSAVLPVLLTPSSSDPFFEK